MQETDDAPTFLVVAKFTRIGTHGRLDRKHVLDQAWILRVLSYQGIGVGSVHEASFLLFKVGDCAVDVKSRSAITVSSSSWPTW